MNLTKLSIEEFLEEVDSKSPAPGGGSVSALSSSLGVSLGRMVGHLTFGKKKYNELDSKIQEQMEKNFEELKNLGEKIKELIDKDTDNFNLVMGAFKLPKITEEEIKIRNEEIQKATLEATYTPLEIGILSAEVLEKLKIFVKYGNKNAITDVGVACLLCEAGGKGAILNVKINLPGIDDILIVEKIKKQIEELSAKLIEDSLEIQNQISEIMA